MRMPRSFRNGKTQAIRIAINAENRPWETNLQFCLPPPLSNCMKSNERSARAYRPSFLGIKRLKTEAQVESTLILLVVA